MQRLNIVDKMEQMKWFRSSLTLLDPYVFTKQSDATKHIFAASVADGEPDHFISISHPFGRFFLPSKATKSKKVLLSFHHTALKTFFFFFVVQALRVTHIAYNSPTLCFYCTQPFGLDQQDWPVPSGEYHFCEGLKQLRQHGGCKLPGDQSKSAHLV